MVGDLGALDDKPELKWAVHGMQKAGILWAVGYRLTLMLQMNAQHACHDMPIPALPHAVFMHEAYVKGQVLPTWLQQPGVYVLPVQDEVRACVAWGIAAQAQGVNWLQKVSIYIGSQVVIWCFAAFTSGCLCPHGVQLGPSHLMQTMASSATCCRLSMATRGRHQAQLHRLRSRKSLCFMLLFHVMHIHASSIHMLPCKYVLATHCLLQGARAGQRQRAAALSLGLPPHLCDL